MATTSEQIKELTSTGGLSYLDAAKQITSTDNSGTTAPVNPTVVNPDGNPVDATPAATPTVNAITPEVAPAPIPAISTPEQGMSATASALENIGATAMGESASQQNLTTQLAAIDKTQVDTKISNAVANQKEFETFATAQMIDKTANEIDYQKSLQENQQEEIAALKLQQTAENDANQASAADLRIKQENAERDLQTANDISIQKSSIAFAKLGLSFSGAAINQAQQIFTDGMYNLSSLKSGNAKDYADLQVKINSTQFDHIRQIGTLISETAEKEFDSKERLRQFIGDTQNNILYSKKESQTAIQEAITTYKTEAQQREDKLYSDMNNANDRLAKATSDITSTLTTSQNNAKTKIDLLIANGQWATLTPEAQVKYESDAGIPTGTTTRLITTNITKNINDRLKGVVGSAVAIPSVTLQKMQTDIQKYMKMGYPMATATQMVVDKYKDKIPGVKAIAASNALKVKAAEADIALTEAKTQKELADATKAISDANRPAGGGGSGAGSQKAYPYVTSSGQALISKNGVPYTLDGSVYTGAIFDVQGSKMGGDVFNPTVVTPYIEYASGNGTPSPTSANSSIVSALSGLAANWGKK